VAPIFFSLLQFRLCPCLKLGHRIRAFVVKREQGCRQILVATAPTVCRRP
jgi:hypothetical protein